MAGYNSTDKGTVQPFTPGPANQTTDYKDMPTKPTEEPTNQDINDNTRPVSYTHLTLPTILLV